MYTKTFYANDIDGCVKCYPEHGSNWIVSSDADFVLNELAHVGSDSLHFKVTQEVYDAVLDTYNIYN
jgi:hypothetical protein